MVEIVACCRDRRGITSMEYGLLGAIVIVALASVTGQYAEILAPLIQWLVAFAATAGAG
jgi:Flp pilus assembly pilin Flp